MGNPVANRHPASFDSSGAICRGLRGLAAPQLSGRSRASTCSTAPATSQSELELAAAGVAPAAAERTPELRAQVAQRGLELVDCPPVPHLDVLRLWDVPLGPAAFRLGSESSSLFARHLHLDLQARGEVRGLSTHVARLTSESERPPTREQKKSTTRVRRASLDSQRAAESTP